MMKRVIAMLMLLASLCAVASEPQTLPDSLQSDSIVFSADSTDSLQTRGGVVNDILIPVALIAATAGVFLLLFTTRSK